MHTRVVRRERARQPTSFNRDGRIQKLHRLFPARAAQKKNQLLHQRIISVMSPWRFESEPLVPCGLPDKRRDGGGMTAPQGQQGQQGVSLRHNVESPGPVRRAAQAEEEEEEEKSWAGRYLVLAGEVSRTLP